MQGKKLLLIRFLNFLQLPRVFRNMSGNRLIVYNYHRIHSDRSSNNTMFDDGVYSATASQFLQQMKWLKENTEILSEEKLLDIIRDGRSFSNPSSLITFDDGYIDNYLIAYPILKQLGIHAIFFIPTHQITARELGWWDIIAYLVKKSRKQSISLLNEKIQIADVSTAINHFIDKMKHESYEHTKDLLNQLSDACGVPIPGNDIQSNELMTWDQIREVSRNGIAIGSHTHRHRVLTTISDEAQKEELMLSKLIIEKEICCKINSIAYPVGNYNHFSETSQHLVSHCGYELGFSFNTGINYGSSIVASNIKRIEPPDELELYTAMAILPNFITKKM